MNIKVHSRLRIVHSTQLEKEKNGIEFDQPCVAEIFLFFRSMEMDIMLIYTDELFIATIYC